MTFVIRLLRSFILELNCCIFSQAWAYNIESFSRKKNNCITFIITKSYSIFAFKSNSNKSIQWKENNKSILAFIKNLWSEIVSFFAVRISQYTATSGGYAQYWNGIIFHHRTYAKFDNNSINYALLTSDESILNSIDIKYNSTRCNDYYCLLWRWYFSLE